MNKSPESPNSSSIGQGHGFLSKRIERDQWADEQLTDLAAASESSIDEDAAAASENDASTSSFFRRNWRRLRLNFSGVSSQLRDTEPLPLTRQEALAPYQAQLEAIKSYGELLAAKSDAELRAMTDELKRDLRNGQTLEQLLPAAFALVNEASVRTLGMRFYDVQFMGGIVIAQGKVAEMKTGEGKTLVATLPVFLHALQETGVHVVTPDDYLSRVGLEIMGHIYDFLGLTSGGIISRGDDLTQPSAFVFDPTYDSGDEHFQHLRPCTRPQAYQADITYGSVLEYGFDQLYDNLITDPESRYQLPNQPALAIVDEIDNVLLDQAQTPLVITSPGEAPSPYFKYFVNLVRPLEPDDYVITQPDNQVYLTDAGLTKIEGIMWKRGDLPEGEHIYDEAHCYLMPYLSVVLQAELILENGKDYLVKKKKIIPLDRETGRQRPASQYSHGIQQALQAVNREPIRPAQKTRAQISIQHLFRQYPKLAGMTGTAATAEKEFKRLYNLDIVKIPPNVESQRLDYPLEIYPTLEAKLAAVVRDVKAHHDQGQPILIGTNSIADSDLITRALSKAGIPSRQLNAKFDAEEADIIAGAGAFGSVIVATRMAGRGVDIPLGGKNSPDEMQHLVAAGGGLYVIGFELGDSRRIDDQLRGRAGRQGDPGASKIVASLEDGNVRKFETPYLKKQRRRHRANPKVLGEGFADPQLEAELLAIQRKVELQQTENRQQLFKYDSVIAQQRRYFFEERHELLTSGPERFLQIIDAILQEELAVVCEQHLSHVNPDDWTLTKLEQDVKELCGVDLVVESWPPYLSRRDIEEHIYKLTRAEFSDRRFLMSLDKHAYAQLHRQALRIMDLEWSNYLSFLEMAQEYVQLESLRERDPFVEYQRQAGREFKELQRTIHHNMLRLFFPAVGQESRPTSSSDISTTLLAYADPATWGSAWIMENLQNNASNFSSSNVVGDPDEDVTTATDDPN